MIYVNQLQQGDMKYEHNVAHGGAGTHNTVAAAGCGLCSLCMIVDNMTFNHLGLEECLNMSYEFGANKEPGTDLKILGAAVAEKYGLGFSITSDREILRKHLQDGGMAVANSGGDREGYTGVFTHGGHYIVVVSIKGDEVCILDPSTKDSKYDEEGRKGKVREALPFVYCSLDVLAKDCENRNPSYYLFSRK